MFHVLFILGLVSVHNVSPGIWQYMTGICKNDYQLEHCKLFFLFYFMKYWILQTCESRVLWDVMSTMVRLSSSILIVSSCTCTSSFSTCLILTSCNNENQGCSLRGCNETNYNYFSKTILCLAIFSIKLCEWFVVIVV